MEPSVLVSLLADLANKIRKVGSASREILIAAWSEAWMY